MSEPDLAAYWRYQALHFKRLAVLYQQELMAIKNRPAREGHHGRGLHKDPTANTAVNRLTKEGK